MRQAWRVMAGQALMRREWEGEAVLFNDLTGATHLLSGTAVWVLERLQTAPADATGLAQALGQAIGAELAADAASAPDGAAESGFEADTVAPAELVTLLHELHKMHLIQPC